MMKSILMTFVAVLALWSCASDNVEEYYSLTDCGESEATFSDDVRAIVSTNCAIPACHVEGTGLPAFTNYQKIAARAGDIKFQTTSGVMPPASSGKDLTIEQVRKIACWVDSGAKNN